MCLCRGPLQCGSIVKNLYLIRHGKSDWNADYEKDQQRPLNTRGRLDAGKIGAYLKRASVSPDRVLCSSAVRTQQTLEILKEEAGWRSEVFVENMLYLADPEDVLRLISRQPDKVETLVIVGHQPFTGQVASLFLGGRPIEVPTGCVIGMEFDALTWSDAVSEEGRLLMHLLPRRLG